jgi:hypothetical protein
MQLHLQQSVEEPQATCKKKVEKAGMLAGAGCSASRAHWTPAPRQSWLKPFLARQKKGFDLARTTCLVAHCFADLHHSPLAFAAEVLQDRLAQSKQVQQCRMAARLHRCVWAAAILTRDTFRRNDLFSLLQ